MMDASRLVRPLSHSLGLPVTTGGSSVNGAPVDVLASYLRGFADVTEAGVSPQKAWGAPVENESTLNGNHPGTPFN